jgi:hypothetical protein
VASPIKLYEVSDIATRMKTCLILHNMGVSDRIMGSVDDTYVPSYVKANDGDDDDDQHDDAPAAAAAEQQSNSEEEEEEEGAGNGDNGDNNNDDGQKVTRWRDLQDSEEHHRLVLALKRRWE